MSRASEYLSPGDSGYDYPDDDDPTPEEIEQAAEEWRDYLRRFGPPRDPTPEELAQDPPF